MIVHAHGMVMQPSTTKYVARKDSVPICTQQEHSKMRYINLYGLNSANLLANALSHLAVMVPYIRTMAPHIRTDSS